MNLDRPSQKNWIGGAIGAVLIAAAGLLLHHTPLGRGLSHWSYDLFFAVHPDIQPPEALIIYMDDESHADLGQPFNDAWDRKLHTQLLNRLTTAGARAVVFDVIFSDPSADPAIDLDFARALAANRNVVLAADTVPAGYGLDEVEMRMVTPPTEVLRDTAARLGSAELMPDQDLVIRKHFHGGPDDLLGSVSWAAAQAVGAPVTQEESQRTLQRYVRYYGPPGTIEAVSYSRALNPAHVPDELLRDRIVFVGARLFTVFAGQRKDEFRTPYSYWSTRNQFMSGVEVQTTISLNLLRGDWLTRWTGQQESLAILLLGFLIGFSLIPFPPWRATLHGAIAVLLLGSIAYITSANFNTWLPWLLPVAQVTLGLGGTIAYHYARMFVKSRVLENSLAAHTSPQRVRQLLKQPELLKPGAAKQELTILFSDIANFTTLSEGMDSDDLATLMNSYFETAISECIHKTDGYVVKYIGDAVFAIWNAPLEQSDHRERACEAALKLRSKIIAFPGHGNATALETRVGLHTGVANVGNFGSANRVDYTALGESINLASRMEGLNKHLGTQVLATRETQIAVENQMVTRRLGRFRLKGFERTVEVFEILGDLNTSQATRPWRDSFATGLEHFEKQAFPAARTEFIKTLSLHPDDGPSQFYLSQIIDIIPELLPDDWNGEIAVNEK